MSKTVKITSITLAAFIIHYFIDDTWFRPLRTWLNSLVHQLGVSHIVTYILVGIPIFAAVLIMHRRKWFLGSLGLDKNIVKAFVFALACTAPMFIGFAFLFELNTNVSLNRILVAIISAALFEELYFRGFLFGQVYRNTSIGFVPAVFLGALLFGLIHLYQGNEFGELLGIFLVTFLGAILFAWAYVEWNYNLWVPVMLHLLMNLAWEIFNISDNALGGLYPNVFRTITIILIIAITVIYKKSKGLPLEINGRTLIMKKKLAVRPVYGGPVMPV